MTVIEAVNRIDSVKPNNYTQADKVAWLSQLDGRVKAEIIDTHEDAPVVNFSGYDKDTPLSTTLLVPYPYDELYPLWLEARIDYANSEYTRYNNSMAMFNTAYADYERYYNRTHMPHGTNLRLF